MFFGTPGNRHFFAFLIFIKGSVILDDVVVWQCLAIGPAAIKSLSLSLSVSRYKERKSESFIFEKEEGEKLSAVFHHDKRDNVKWFFFLLPPFFLHVSSTIGDITITDQSIPLTWNDGNDDDGRWWFFSTWWIYVPLFRFFGRPVPRTQYDGARRIERVRNPLTAADGGGLMTVPCFLNPSFRIEGVCCPNKFDFPSTLFFLVIRSALPPRALLLTTTTTTTKRTTWGRRVGLRVLPREALTSMQRKCWELLTFLGELVVVIQ